MSKRRVYRIHFVSQDKVYELYAKSVSQGGLYGFVEAEGLLFGEKSSVVVDPGEERLKAEFQDVSKTFIPMHTVLRIDEVTQVGVAKIVAGAESGGKVTPFPVYTGAPNGPGKV